MGAEMRLAHAGLDHHRIAIEDPGTADLTPTSMSGLPLESGVSAGADGVNAPHPAQTAISLNGRTHWSLEIVGFSVLGERWRARHQDRNARGSFPNRQAGNAEQ
jgi:hypothetical protein